MTGKVIVLGAGPVGLTTAMLLAQDGHEVTVLEKDRQGPPATGLEAWESWERKGVAQFRQAHGILPGCRHVLEAELPDVYDELVAAGGRRYNLTSALPGVSRGGPAEPGDERFDLITARRPVLESAFARVAEDTPGVKILRGLSATAPITGSGPAAGIPHVLGVRTSDDGSIDADLVIDAMGRRSRFSEWVRDAGGRAPYEESSDTGFAYYTRHYRSRNGSVPEFRGFVFTTLSTFGVLTIPADNTTWTIAVVAMAGDQPLKALRHNEVWERVVRSIPHIAHWLDGEPVTDVLPMAGVMDRYRRFVVNEQPVVTGMLAVGDAWACTNPTAGRGISLGLTQAVLLRNALADYGDYGDDPVGLARAFHESTEQTLTPWYRQQMEQNYQRARDVQAAIEGRPVAEPSKDRAAQLQAAFFTAANADGIVGRAFLDVVSCLALPHEVIRRPGIVERVSDFVGADPVPTVGPSRSQLLAMMT
jgi:2-polyprenyl-6-methoxyphenol hydroxylase-like FAD-dependent oxidoreductase